MVELARGLRWMPLFVGMSVMPFALVGCNSFKLDDGVPNTAPQATVVGPRQVPRPQALAKSDTGVYPTFAGPLTAANTQISDAEATTAQDQMTKLAAARANGSVSEADYQARVAELRKLAADHAADTQSQISK
ncbi:hypothetical protein [Rhizobium sp. SGZ-381]|uniref:hypothetical protein n=1 Tax=Rhizobium sp. SGZ-381 TaxID=3342800 RepID=UPI00366C1870